MVARSVSAATPLLKDVLNIAATNGVDLKRALGWSEPSPQVASGDPDELRVQDFLRWMDLLSQRDTRSTGRRIRCSILISARGGLAETFACLQSVVRNTELDNAELIVIHGELTGDWARLFAHLRGLIKVLDDSDGGGLARAANTASGEWQVFLGSDVRVEPDWLRSLLSTADHDSSAGAVGSMVLGNDGRLREAGGVIWRDGRLSAFGSGENATEPKFNIAREADYCSTAALLIRRDLFLRLEGFQEQYASPSYQAANLCFGIRSLGFKVTYQPLSKAVLRQTRTADSHAAEKALMEDQGRFVDKWGGSFLKQCPEYRADSVETAARRHCAPARIVVFDGSVPEPDKDAGGARMFAVLKSLASTAKTVFVPTFGAPETSAALALAREGIEVVPRLECDKWVSNENCEVILLSRVAVADEMLAFVRRANKHAKVIFDTVDIHSVRLQGEFEITGSQDAAREAEVCRRQEQRLVSLCDQVWCVSERDKRVLETDCPQQNYRIIPTIHAPQQRGAPFAARSGLLFIGSFLHRPNRDALSYSIAAIQPRLSTLLPGVKLYVVGSGMDDQIRALASDDVVIMGYVPRVDEIFQRSRLFIAPLRYGAGINGKIGQALSYGLPVVTTSIGAEGFGLRNGDEALIAEDPTAFADAVARAYNDEVLWQRLSDDGYRHVQSRFSPDVVQNQISAAIAELVPSLGSVAPVAAGKR